MHHYTVTVALPGETQLDEVEKNLAGALEPFNKEKEVEQATDPLGRTYWTNPAGRWDWYLIGGRWSHHLPIRAGADPADLIFGSRSWGNTHAILDPTFCDGGRIRALDLERKRAAQAKKALADWNDYAAVIAGTPQHQAWETFSTRAKEAEQAASRPWHEFYTEAKAKARANAGLGDNAAPDDTADRYSALLDEEMDRARAAWNTSLAYSFDQAKRDYQAQPRIAALRAHEAYRGRGMNPPEREFGDLDRDTYIQQCRDQAIPGYAMLTHDGRWLSADMPWVPSSDDRARHAAHLIEVNTYLDSLADNMILILVDCHT
ncbi:hypothetical protein [Amycolatopsis saalfeldensis]|uniref:Uncharacterized protein n=1 Tax=Amycolatopsis saalfeldensis TaxID=394193 RepID=A0A1H8YQV6_9PSEU|nr:hypothetical protein [Amycolatopsis saalfeldensis]SEP54432.1 hypothetical protein SAMN04489732_1478 [Amycolatopsis saalfeldensis]